MINRKKLFKRIFITCLVLVLGGAGVVWFLFTKTFQDTANVKADYIVNALAFLQEYKANDTLANKKYAEKIISVNGRVSSVEHADTTLNVKMEDSTGAYIIFAFQQKDLAAIKKIKEGDAVSIKGSCNGGTYSQILETVYIAFKRCSLNK